MKEITDATISAFGFYATLYKSTDTGSWFAIVHPLRSCDERVLKAYIMYLEYVKYYLETLNNEM